MWNDLTAWADQTIPRPTKGVVLQKRNYSLRDIADLCHQAFLEDREMLREFSRAFSPDRAGLRSLFDFVDGHFNYTEDPSTDAYGNSMPVQAVQSPAAMWHLTRDGDCKSYTVFIASVIHHMGIPVILRLVDYGKRLEKHIYPVAVLDGQEVPVDVVYWKQQGGRFGTEKNYSMKIKDIVEKPGLYKVGATSGTPTVTVDEVNQAMNQLKARFSAIPDEVLNEDITEMTAGEFERWQMRRRLQAFLSQTSDPEMSKAYQAGIAALNGAGIAAIGNVADTKFGKELAAFIQKTEKDTAPAFKPVKIRLPNIEDPEVAGIGDWVKKTVKKVTNTVKKVVETVADTVGDAFKKLVNVFHKEDAGKVSPYFLYLYMTPTRLAQSSPEVKKRHAEQSKMLDYMEKKGKLGTRGQILATMATEYKKKTGYMPQEILYYAHKFPAKVNGVTDVMSQAGQASSNAQNAATGGTAEAQILLKASNEMDKSKAQIQGILKGIVNFIASIFGKKDKDDQDFENRIEGNESDLTLLYQGQTYTKQTQLPDGTTFYKNEQGQTVRQNPDGSVDVVSEGGGGGNMGLLLLLGLGGLALVASGKK